MNALPLPPLLERLVGERGWSCIGSCDLERFVTPPGAAIVFVTDDPKVQKEVLDVAVILPELVRPAPGAPRVALLDPACAGDAGARFGTRRTPALVYFRDGRYLGAIEGLLDWAGFVAEHARLLAAPARRPPTVGVAIAAPRAGSRSAAGIAA